MVETRHAVSVGYYSLTYPFTHPSGFMLYALLPPYFIFAAITGLPAAIVNGHAEIMQMRSSRADYLFFLYLMHYDMI